MAKSEIGLRCEAFFLFGRVEGRLHYFVKDHPEYASEIGAAADELMEAVRLLQGENKHGSIKKDEGTDT